MSDTRTIKLTLEYDGTHFAGWQVQPNQRTIQGEIESGLLAMTEETIRIMGSGRTDAGVHALGQVASFKTSSKLPLIAFGKGLNQHLPEDIRILSADAMPSDFNARREARKRSYRYVFARRPCVIDRHFSWYPRCAIDLPRMEEASAGLKGLRDITAFSKASEDIDDYFSEIYNVSWKQSDKYIHFEITASRFFHHTIRILLGTLLHVNTCKISIKEFRDILEQKDRGRAGPTIPPQGLFLVRVDY